MLGAMPGDFPGAMPDSEPRLPNRQPVLPNREPDLPNQQPGLPDWNLFCPFFQRCINHNYLMYNLL